MDLTSPVSVFFVGIFLALRLQIKMLMNVKAKLWLNLVMKSGLGI
jgi:hypothetical protein